MSKKAPLYAQIVIPLGMKGTFTYEIPQKDIDIAETGMRVLVQFGKKKLYSGIIHEIHQDKPEHFEPKPIISFLDEKALLNQYQLQFWDWISSYYMCSIGEVMNAALPHGLKLQSETLFHINDDFSSPELLTKEDRNFIEYIRDDGIQRMDDLPKGPYGDGGVKILKQLIDKGALHTDQKIKQGYKPRKISCIGIEESYVKEKDVLDMMDKLKRTPSQLKAVEEYLQLSGRFMKQEAPREVSRKELSSAGVASHAILGLLKKNFFYQYEITVSRIHHAEDNTGLVDPFPLTDHQEHALKEVRLSLQKLPAVLLHGVTSSGKTELYIHLIQEQIEKGKQVLYLLPEIALTTQIIKRLKHHFGHKIGVYHSKYSDSERVEVYRNLAGMTDKVPYDIILGVRSAVFLPFQKLGLIIIDEEHENTYKQFDPAPRYNARDASTILGLYTGAKIVLGTATPSFESFYNARTGKYGLVELKQRFGDIGLPEVIIADVKQARKRKQLKSHFTPELLDSLEETLKSGKQAILFQNRRGYSNYLQCGDCGEILKCKECDVSLTYHKFSGEMICHYCGVRMKVPQSCPKCHESALQMRGFGTEKIEDELAIFFPEANIGRLDLDKMKSRKSFEKLMDDFESGKIHILVGTQLVTKGLDFENVALVGILDADSMLNFPDFRAFERSFQLMTQVSGRAGRRDLRGKVVIQTTDPGHPVIQRVLNNDFHSFYSEQMAEREMFKYPPIVRFIRITLRHEIPSILDGGALFLSKELKEIFGYRILGPQYPPVNRTHGKYIKQIIMKIEKGSSFERAKELTAELLEIFTLNPVYKQIRVTVDIDPL